MSQAVILYIPALHQGYLNFFAKYPGDLFILGADLVHETPRLDRDIRALKAENVRSMLEPLGIMKKVAILRNVADLKVLAAYDDIILPDEDISRNFAQNHLSKQDHKLVPFFLRWEKQISTTEYEVPPHRKISRDALDNELMSLAFDDAPKSSDWWRQVGAVVARDGKPIMIGHNRPLPAEDYTLGAFGDPRSNFDYGEYIELSKVIHGEASLIAEAAKKGVPLEGASIYITTFPCPVCAKSIAAAGFIKVYYSQGYSLLDAEDILKAHNIELILVQK
jgi:dCMP deaminase